jgi:Bacterial aa3 type cytochrome c oxidase subunit IV
MADHGTVEFATAAGNDYPAHEQTYEHFVQHVFVGIIFIINILLGLTVGGVMGHWLGSIPIFSLAIIGVVPGLTSGSKTSSSVAFALCFLIFAFNGLSAP